LAGGRLVLSMRGTTETVEMDMDQNQDQNVAVDERPVVRPLTGNQTPAPDQEWDDAEDEDDEDDVEVEATALADDDTEDVEAIEDEDEDDGFADDERDPFARARPALAPLVDTEEASEDAPESGETRSPVKLDSAVFARIAECLHTAINQQDEKLVRARELAEREPFYTGFVRVLEGQRRRYVRGLERLSQAESLAASAPLEAEPAQAEPVDAEPAQLV